MPEQGDNGKVIITTVDLYNKLLDIELKMGERIGNLEKFRWVAAGGGTVLGAVVGIFGAYLTNYVLHR